MGGIVLKEGAPVRRLRKPPVRAPAAMEFQGSSLCRTATSVQSKVENRPPQTAKLPPIRGASRRMACACAARQLHQSHAGRALCRQLCCTREAQLASCKSSACISKSTTYACARKLVPSPPGTHA